MYYGKVAAVVLYCLDANLLEELSWGARV